MVRIKMIIATSSFYSCLEIEFKIIFGKVGGTKLYKWRKIILAIKKLLFAKVMRRLTILLVFILVSGIISQLVSAAEYDEFVVTTESQINNESILDLKDSLPNPLEFLEVERTNNETETEEPTEIQEASNAPTLQRAGRAISYNLNLTTSTGTAIGNGIRLLGNEIIVTQTATGKEYVLSGTSTNKRLIVEAGVTTKLIFSGASMTVTNGSPFSISGSNALRTRVEIELTNQTTNTFVSTAVDEYSVLSNAIQFSDYVDVIIGGTGKLIAKGGVTGAGIGSTARMSGTNNLVINSGEITATGGAYGAGIGLGSASSSIPGNWCIGAISINGGIVVATGGNYGAGIGSGQTSGEGNAVNINSININNATVTASSLEDGAGIGSGETSYNAVYRSTGGITVTNSSLTVSSARQSGIGTGRTWENAQVSLGDLKITGGMVNSTAGGYGAGIGSSSVSGGVSIIGDIILKNTLVTSTGGSGGAGIGTGMTQNAQSSSSSTIRSIVISGGEVISTGGYNGAGIGLGDTTNESSENRIEKIEITDAKVKATGGTRGAGIGTGAVFTGADMTDSIRVETIRLNSGEITAIGSSTTSGIGKGRNDVSTFMPVTSLTIGESAKVTAVAGSVQPISGIQSVTGKMMAGYVSNSTYPFNQNESTSLEIRLPGSAEKQVMELPKGYRGFAYSTKSSVSETNVIAKNSASKIVGIFYYTQSDRDIVLKPVSNNFQSQSLMVDPIVVLGTLSATNISTTTADIKSTGHVFHLAGMAEETAFHLDTQSSMVTKRSYLWGNELNPYTANLSGLGPNTRYFYQSYLKSELGEAVQATPATSFFVTKPEFKGDKLTAIRKLNNQIEVSGEFIASLNNEAITRVQVTYSKASDFSVSPVTETVLSANVTNTNFTHMIQGNLLQGTKYYVRVVVQNAGGTTTSTTIPFQLSVPVMIKYVNMAGDSIGQPAVTVKNVGIGESLTLEPIAISGYQAINYRVDDGTTTHSIEVPLIITEEVTLMVYYGSTSIDLTIPTTMDFYVDETTGHGVSSSGADDKGFYTFENQSELPVMMQFNGMRVVEGAGLTFVSNAEGGADTDIHLGLVRPQIDLGPITNALTVDVLNIQPTEIYAPAPSRILGVLDGQHVLASPSQSSRTGCLTITGHYAGSLSTPIIRPQVTMEFLFQLQT